MIPIMQYDSEYPKSVLITGGAVRIGRTTALHLARKGWNVVIHYRHSGDEIPQDLAELKALKVKAVAVQADLRVENALSGLIRQATATLGMPLTALVNNAAVFEKDQLSTFTRSDWDKHMDVNLYAPLRLIADFAAQLPSSSHGSVVNLIDGCEAMCMSPAFLTYSLSKYGLAHATRLLAQDLAPRIRVNGISPGLTLPKAGEEAMFDRLVAKLPLQRPTAPEEIAAMVAHLLESPSITGQIVALDGGASVC
jgi:NAD(P)-dependent dehydrogenase (short-subunit alcohol dehydrogenase family)